MCLNGFTFKELQKHYTENMEKIVGAIWELPAKLANPAQFGWKWAGLTVIFSRQLPNGFHDYISYFQHIYFYIFKHETIETDPCPRIFDTYLLS